MQELSLRSKAYAFERKEASSRKGFDFSWRRDAPTEIEPFPAVDEPVGRHQFPSR